MLSVFFDFFLLLIQLSSHHQHHYYKQASPAMKITFLSLAVLASVALAAPPAMPGKNASCMISGGVKPVWTKIIACCVKNKGRSEFDKMKNELDCKLPVSREGSLRKCVKLLGFAAVVHCKK